jgi:hypothetical protein
MSNNVVSVPGFRWLLQRAILTALLVFAPAAASASYWACVGVVTHCTISIWCDEYDDLDEPTGQTIEIHWRNCG